MKRLWTVALLTMLLVLTGCSSKMKVVMNDDVYSFESSLKTDIGALKEVGDFYTGIKGGGSCEAVTSALKQCLSTKLTSPGQSVTTPPAVEPDIINPGGENSSDDSAVDSSTDNGGSASVVTPTTNVPVDNAALISSIMKDIDPVVLNTLLKNNPGIIDKIMSSNTSKPSAPPNDTPTVTPVAEKKTECGDLRGRTNGNRQTWYFKHDMKWYPKTFKLDVPGCKSFTVNNNGNRWTSGTWVIKQSDVSGRGMAILAESSCDSTKACVEY